MKRSRNPAEQPPPGCRKCKGARFIEIYDEQGNYKGLGRCDCPRGVWYTQKERPRFLQQQRLALAS